MLDFTKDYLYKVVIGRYVYKNIYLYNKYVLPLTKLQRKSSLQLEKCSLF